MTVRSRPAWRRFLVLAALPLLATCGRKPAQDYYLIGTLKAGEALRNVPLERLYQPGMNGRADLVMTVRSSPDVGDVIIQRRWRDVRLPHAFGLGKGRGQELAAKYGQVWVTAMLDIFVRDASSPVQTFVGWTSEPIAAQSQDVEIALTHRLGEADPGAPGYPKGGWESKSVREEAVPPGLARQVRSPGPRVFSGTIDVPESSRLSLRECRLFVIARHRAARGAPELVTSYDHPTFPFSFSLHENQVLMGTPGPVEKPKFVVALLDVDGSIDSKGDQVRIATEKPVEPLASDVRLVFSAEMVGKLLPSRTPPPERTPEPRAPGARGELIAAGRITLPDGVQVVSGSVLWLSVRNPDTRSSVLVTKVDGPTFPHDFALHQGDNLFGETRDIDHPIRVRAILTAPGMDLKDPGAYVATSATVEVGAKNVNLSLAAGE